VGCAKTAPRAFHKMTPARKMAFEAQQVFNLTGGPLGTKSSHVYCTARNTELDQGWVSPCAPPSRAEVFRVKAGKDDEKKIEQKTGMRKKWETKRILEKSILGRSQHRCLFVVCEMVATVSSAQARNWVSYKQSPLILISSSSLYFIIRVICLVMSSLFSMRA